jgi:hypothetical protein
MFERLRKLLGRKSRSNSRSRSRKVRSGHGRRGSFNATKYLANKEDSAYFKTLMAHNDNSFTQHNRNYQKYSLAQMKLAKKQKSMMNKKMHKTMNKSRSIML